MTIDLGQLLVWLIVGALAGFIAGQVWKGRGFGAIGNIVVGLLGALIGGVLFNLLNINISGLATFSFSLLDLIIAVAGALILLFILRFVRV